MNATQLLAHFDRLAEAPDAVPRLRRFILDLAVRGKLVEQDAGDEPAGVLLKRIRSLVRKSLAPKKSNQQVDVPDAEVDPPFEIPQSWMWTRLFELGRTQTGATPSKNAGEVYGNHMPFVKPGDLLPSHVDYSGEGLSELGLKDSGRFTPAGSLLMVCIGTIGKCQLVDRACSFNQQINSIAPYDCLESRYLLAVFMSEFFQSAAWTASAKTTIAILNKGKWEQLSVPLPPFAEQHRIVAKVDELMALCDQLEAAQQERERRRDRLAAASLQRLNQPAADTTPEAQREHARFHLQHLPRLTTQPEHIKAMRQMVLNFAVHGWLVPQIPLEGCASDALSAALASRRASWISKQTINARTNGKVLAKNWQTKYVDPIHEDGMFDLQQEWVWASTLEVCECVENGNTPSPHEMSDGIGEIPFLKVYNLTKTGELDFTVKPTFISRQVHEGKLQRSRILAGDVLMNIVGPPLGKVSLVTNQYPEWNTNQAVVLFRPSNVLVPKYLTICLLSDAVLTWITRQAQATVGQSNISVSKSRALPIPLPPLAEQHRIVVKVDELMVLCDQLEAQLATTQTDSRRLLESVLEAALAPA